MYIQSIKFIITGLINTLVSFFVYYLSFSILKHSYSVSLIFAYAFGILNSYIWNSKWTFQKNSFVWKGFAKFILIYVLTFLINLIILGFTIKIIKINELISQAFALIIAGILSFMGYKYWCFANDSKDRNISN
jgi:putative flippase GtrA